ncbi:hypothetical protein PBAL39_15799 [Pedobacter sp. BAL39]|nr:hypothetical protein PBAL39_15799 [Pedobacter sp. BAL39]
MRAWSWQKASASVDDLHNWLTGVLYRTLMDWGNKKRSPLILTSDDIKN